MTNWLWLSLAAILVFLFLRWLFGGDDSPEPVNLVPDPNLVTMKIPASGREVFTPVLVPNRVYRLTVSGHYEFYRPGFFDGEHRVGEADAIFFTDSRGNFNQPYDRLRVNGRHISTLPRFQTDRHLHKYSFELDGEGTWLPIQLLPPSSKYQSHGSLTVAIRLLPKTTQTCRQEQKAEALVRAQKEAVYALQVAELFKREQEEANRRAKLAAEAEARRRWEEEAAVQRRQQEAERERQLKAQKEAARKQATLQKRVGELKVFVRLNRNVLDAAYRAWFVREFQEAILTEWRQDWRKDYEKLHSNTDLVAALKTQAPEVLEWYENQIDLILQAERLEVLPVEEPAAVCERQITPRTIGDVEFCIEEWFRSRQVYDGARKQQAHDDEVNGHRATLRQALRDMDFQREQLARYGIQADTPEQAEAEFLRLCPREPAPTYYEELSERLLAGEKIPPDAIVKRLKDLYVEELILQAKRRSAIREEDSEDRDELDRRLAAVRREFTSLKTLTDAIDCPVEWKDPREPLSREEQFFKNYVSQQRVIAVLQAQGDTEAIEHVKTLYAEDQAKLFQQNTDSYT